jgi:type II secretory pathway component PulM
VSSFAGLLFLLGGVALCFAAILLLVVWERSGRSPRRSLERFEQTRHSLHKIHRTQETLRDAGRARARAMHPSARVPTARRPGSSRHRKYA